MQTLMAAPASSAKPVKPVNPLSHRGNVLSLPSGDIWPEGAGRFTTGVYSDTSSGLQNVRSEAIHVYVDPSITEQDRLDFLLLNYLLRPPLTDAEIRLMPARDVITLYYSINQIIGCGDGNQVKPDNVISRGLPLYYAMKYGYNLVSRIFNLRPDLHLVTDAVGHRYQVLISPLRMRPEHCDEDAVAIQALAAAASIVAAGVASVIVSAIVTAATTAATKIEAAGRAAAIAKAKALGQEVAYGVQVATSAAYNPQQELIDEVRQKEQRWSALVTWSRSRTGILRKGKDFPYPERYLAISYLADFKRDKWSQFGVARPNDVQLQNHIITDATRALSSALLNNRSRAYADDWQPYSKFYYSDAVAQLASAGQPVSHITNRTSSVDSSDEGSGGLGILSLLLLLL